MKELNLNEMEQIIGGAGGYPPLPETIKNTIYMLVLKLKRKGYTLDMAVQAAKASVNIVYALEVEAFVCKIWDTL